jgi:glucose-6-phosphate 1-dehydrogenase
MCSAFSPLEGTTMSTSKKAFREATAFLKQFDSLLELADQVEEAWGLVMPIIENWESSPPEDFPNYASGTWGPKEADELLARDGRAWRNGSS